MKNLSNRLRAYKDKKRYEIILHDRSHLTDYEKEILIPELISRLNVLREYFGEIISLCDKQKNNDVFSQAVLSVINPNNFEADPRDSQISPAQKFFGEVKDVAQTQGIDDLNKILLEHGKIENLKQLGHFLTDVNNFCFALATVNNNLLLYKIETYPFLTNIKTGQTAVTFPPQYALTVEPFQLLVSNIVGVSKAITETVNDWHKYFLKLKSDYLDLHIKRLSVSNMRWLFAFNVTTIVLAVVLSAFFLLANDPFNLIKENRVLKSQIVAFVNRTPSGGKG